MQKPLSHWGKPSGVACLSIGLALVLVGCGTQPAAPAAPNPASQPPSASTPSAVPVAKSSAVPDPLPKADNAGTAKIEFNIYLDPSAIMSIDGNEYTPKEMEEPIQLKAGLHQIAVKQLGIKLSPQEFSVETGKRKIVRAYEPERVAAEVVVGLGGPVHFIVNGQKIAKLKSALPNCQINR